MAGKAIRPPRRRMRPRLSRRRSIYRPTIFTIQQVLDTIPYELDLGQSARVDQAHCLG